MPKIRLRFKGGSIAYTLMISLMVSGLFSVFWLMQSHHQQFLSKVLGKERALANMVSGLNQFCIAKRHETDCWQTALFESKQDSATLRMEPWGLYQLAICRGKHGNHMAQKAALLGQAPRGYFAKSLFLADHRQQLCLSGNSYLGGTCVLPGGSYKTATVSGLGFTGSQLPTGPVYSSFLKEVQTDIPAFAALHKNFLLHAESRALTYSLRDWEMNCPWDQPACFQTVTGNLKIEACQASGKCIISASQDIIIDSSARLDMVLVFGKNIHIRPGFQGRIQVFATESIHLAEKVELAYPSILCLLPQGSTEGKIALGENCVIAGGIGVADTRKTKRSFVKISRGTAIQGHVWGMEKLELRGTVSGSVITEHFSFQTAGKHYHNYLVDAQIDSRKLPRDFAMPVLQRHVPWRRVCWLGEEIRKLGN